MEQVPAAIIEDDQCHDAAGLLLLVHDAAGLLLHVGASSRASILVGQVPHCVGIGNMAEKPKLTSSNHRNKKDTSRPTQHTATLPPNTAHIPTSSIAHNIKHGYCKTHYPYFFHFKLQTSNFKLHRRGPC